jgi:hypothetical protein
MKELRWDIVFVVFKAFRFGARSHWGQEGKKRGCVWAGYNYNCGAGEEACNLTTNVEALFFGDGV